MSSFGTTRGNAENIDGKKKKKVYDSIKISHFCQPSKTHDKHDHSL